MGARNIAKASSDCKFGDLLGGFSASSGFKQPPPSEPVVNLLQPDSRRYRHDPKTFDDWGFTLNYPVLSITPPGARISEGSSLLPKALGKAPGEMQADETWRGMPNWQTENFTASDYLRWNRTPANKGVNTGRYVDKDGQPFWLVCLDADVEDPVWAAVIRAKIEKHLGRDLPERVGRAPKTAFFIRVAEPVLNSRISFSPDNGAPGLFEVLSDGRQVVVQGVHPKTGKPYTWPIGVPAIDEIPIYSLAVLEALLSDIERVLPKGQRKAAGSKASVNQARLGGDLEKVSKAVGLIPNDYEARDEYIKIGHAIKAALPDDEPAALELFQDWASRWTAGENDPDVVERDFYSFAAPYRCGASYLYKLAEQQAPEQFSEIEVYFQPIPDEPENPFEAQHKSVKAEEECVEIAWIKPRDWHGADVPKRKWLVDGVIPDGEVTLLTGDGGTGKTLLAQQMGTCVAQGLPFLGRSTVQGKVAFFLCEDAPDELHRRQRDINRALCLGMPEIDNSMRFASRKYADNLLALFDRSTGVLKRNALFNSLVSYCKEFGAKLVVVDTIADTFGGSEIDRSQVRQFVQGTLGRLAQEIGGAVLALGHPSRAGKASGEGTSGSTAWHASVRSRLYLEHASKDGAGPFRRLTNKKANYGPAGDVWLLKWSAGTFEAITEKTAASDPAMAAKRLSAIGSLASACLADVLEAVRQLNALAAERAREGAAQGMMPLRAAGTTAVLSSQRNSSSFAPKVLATRFPELLGMYTAADLEAAFQRAVDGGALVQAVVGRRANRMPMNGYHITEKAAAMLETDNTQANKDEGVNDNSSGVFE